MNDSQIDLFSSDEFEGVPGQLYLELTTNVAHAQGPSHFYAIVLKLNQMARLERPQDSEASMSLSIWERELLRVANWPETVLLALGSIGSLILGRVSPLECGRVISETIATPF